MMRTIQRYLTVEILARVVADILLLNAGLIAGLLARSVGLLFFESEPVSVLDLRKPILQSWSIYQRDAPLLIFLGLMIFSLSGFYTRGRAYRSRYKVLIIIQAVSLTYLLFGFLTYFVPVFIRFPRSAFISAWIITGVLVLGARFVATIWGQVVRREERLDIDDAEINRKANILVIGGAGYIGSVLCRQLLERGYHVRVLDALLYGNEGISSLYANPDFEFVRGDIRDLEVISTVMRDMDAIVHLGEIVGDPATGIDEQFAQEINIAATQMVAQVARGYGVKRFIYASSCSVYGASNELLDERSSLNPVSIYARAKRDAESILFTLDNRDFHPTILRFATVYGSSPRQRFDLVINLLTAKAIVDGEIEIFGGDQWRPFVHVGDVAHAIILILEAPLVNVKRQIFNVGSDDQNYRIEQLGEIICDLIPGTKLTTRATDIDRRDYHVSFAKIHQQLGFDAQVTVREGVKEIEQGILSARVGHYANPEYSNYKTLSDEHGQLDISNGSLTELPSLVRPSLEMLSLSSTSRESTGWQTSFLVTMIDLATFSMDNAPLTDKLQRSHDVAVESWFRSLDRRQKEAEGHTLRVTELAIEVGQEMGLSEAELTHLRRGALLHDIGRLGIPARILVKPGPLSDDEWAIVCNHPHYAYEILSPMVNLRPSLDIPYCHHERWDGTGYPRALRGENIPLAARIFSVVDVWDSLRADKPYRAAWSEGDAWEHIQSHAGAQFDPRVVESFAKVCPIFEGVQLQAVQ